MKLKISHLILFTLIVYIFSANATIRFVSKTGTSTPPYTSWQTAADSIQKCINICIDGDTIYVANGVYYEYVYVDKNINIIGTSADSTIVNGYGTPGNYIFYFFENNSSIENFQLKSPNQLKIGIYTWYSNLSAKNFTIDSVAFPIRPFNSSVNINDFIIKNFTGYNAIFEECPADTCHPTLNDNIIISKNNGATPPVSFGFGGYPTFTNNIVIDEGGTLKGVDTYTHGLLFENNLVANYQKTGILLYPMPSGNQTARNNIITNISGSGVQNGSIGIGVGENTNIENNILKNSYRGIYNVNPSQVRSDYDLFWKLEELISGQPFLGDSNIIADPMFLNDTVPTADGNYDFHLQAYSPAIDKGNPNIFDKDGTRSDIGMYGGPFGETYTYQDLAPLAPRNLSAIVDSNNITVKWNRNTEADTAFYKVYRDTVINFQIDSTKLISTQTDTFFIHLPPYNSSKYVYKITCVDNQSNESQPSQELVVNITSVSTDDYPVNLTDYVLYQNYPNPFNPSTKIGYQLKERGYVKLMIYDIKGELISVLVNKEQTAGYYEIEFSSSGIPHSGGQNPVSSINGIASGIYLYRIEVIGEGRIPVYTEMKKMLLIK